MMSALLRTIGRAMTAFALLIGIGAGVLTAAAPAQAAPSTAYQVTVGRTGGFAGVDEQYTVLSHTVHLSTPELMYAVNGREFRTLRKSYLPPQPGADRFTYTVTVPYTNGRTKTVSVNEGAEAPAVLWQVIDLTMRISNDLATSAG